VSITKIMIASAPAMKGEAGQLLSAEVGQVRFVTVVLSFACPAEVAWLYRRGVLDMGRKTFIQNNTMGRMAPCNARRGWGGHQRPRAWLWTAKDEGRLIMD
jgi:hypothetical protein